MHRCYLENGGSHPIPKTVAEIERMDIYELVQHLARRYANRGLDRERIAAEVTLCTFVWEYQCYK